MEIVDTNYGLYRIIHEQNVNGFSILMLDAEKGGEKGLVFTIQVR